MTGWFYEYPERSPERTNKPIFIMPIQNLIAIALKYNETEDDTPSVVAQGNMLLAGEMKSVARRYGIPICTDGKLAGNLSRVETAQPVPENLYFDVARVFTKL